MGMFGRKGQPEPVAEPDSGGRCLLSADDLQARMRNSKALVSQAGELEKKGDISAARDRQIKAVAALRVISALLPESGVPLLGISLARLGGYQSRLGERDEALANRREAARLLKPTTADGESRHASVHAANLFELTLLLDTPDTQAEMAAVGAEAIHQLRQVGVDSPKRGTRLAKTLNRVANGLNKLGRGEEALRTRLEHVQFLDELREQAPDSHGVALAMSLSSLAVLHVRANQCGEAAAASERCHALLAAPGFVASVADRAVLATNFRALAANLGSLGWASDARRWFSVAADLYRALDSEAPGEYREALICILNSHAWQFRESDATAAEGLALIEEALKLADAWDAPDSGGYIRHRAMVLDTAAELYCRAGRHAEALPLARESVDLCHEFQAKYPMDAPKLVPTASCERLLARIEDRLADSTRS